MFFKPQPWVRFLLGGGGLVFYGLLLELRLVIHLSTWRGGLWNSDSSCRGVSGRPAPKCAEGSHWHLPLPARLGDQRTDLLLVQEKGRTGEDRGVEEEGMEDG